jgi:uncharacterized membrane protein HdeD (DUF308 family)
MSSSILKDVHSGGSRMKVFGVISLILGLIAIAAPAFTGLSVLVSVGFLVMGGGVLRMLWAFGAGTFGKGVLAFAIGVLTLLCGIALVTNPLFTSGFLTILIAICLFADGLAELVGSFSVGPNSGRGWLIIGGIASMVLAVMIWRQYPFSGLWAIGVLLGVKLLFVGITMLTVGSGVKSFAKGLDNLARGGA